MRKVLNLWFQVLSVLAVIAGSGWLVYYYAVVRLEEMQETYHIQFWISFDEVNGLYKDARFRVFGKDIGMVKEMKVENNQSMVRIASSEDIAVYSNYRILMEPRNLAGAYYIELEPGDENHEKLTSSLHGQTFYGHGIADPITTVSKMFAENSFLISQIVKNLEEVSKKVDEEKGTLGKLALNEKSYQLLIKFLEEAKGVTTDYRRMTQFENHDLKRLDWIRTLIDLNKPVYNPATRY